MSNSLVENVQTKYLAYQDAVNKYNNSLNKLNFAYRKYVNMNENSSQKLNRVVKDSNGSKYYVTPQGILKQIGNTTNYDCPDGNTSAGVIDGSVLSNGQMVHVPLDSSSALSSDEKNDYFITGKNLSSKQPCNYFNQEISINLPDKSSNQQEKMCNWIFSDTSKSNMITHSDMTSASLEECKVRAEDVGHDSFGITDVNLDTSTGTCVTGEQKSSYQEASLIRNKEIINSISTDPNVANARVTLQKNGNLVMWKLQGEDSLYNSISKDVETNKILWQSKSNGGSVDDSCHAYYGGSINSVDAQYGLNCGLELSQFTN